MYISKNSLIQYLLCSICTNISEKNDWMNIKLWILSISEEFKGIIYKLIHRRRFWFFFLKRWWDFRTVLQHPKIYNCNSVFDRITWFFSGSLFNRTTPILRIRRGGGSPQNRKWPIYGNFRFCGGSAAANPQSRGIENIVSKKISLFHQKLWPVLQL